MSDYCGRKVTNHTLDEFVDPYIWNLYHSFYFSFTTCTTVGKFEHNSNAYSKELIGICFNSEIGYGNISPSSSLGRIILCFYALFGLPVSCYLLAVVAKFFERTVSTIDLLFRRNNHRTKIFSSSEFTNSIRTTKKPQPKIMFHQNMVLSAKSACVSHQD